MIHLYAFVSGLRDVPEDVEIMQIGSITAVYAEDVDDTHDDVVRHGLVTEALVEAADGVLPARFGERFADREALAAAVDARAAELARLLDSVAGCVELAVRVARVSDERAREGVDGTDYMRSRLREVSADAATVAELRSLLERRARAAAVAEPPPVRLLHDAGYLVGRDDVDAFAADVEEYAAVHPELTVVCTGPWAPSSFAGAA